MSSQYENIMENVRPSSGYDFLGSNTDNVAPTYEYDHIYHNTKHGSKYGSLIMAILVLLIILIIVYLLMPRSFSKRLECNGWVVYFMTGCYYCDKQKRILDRDFRKFVECDSNGNQIGGLNNPPIPCGSSIITGYPFWYNTRTSETKPGYQNIGDLELMAL